MNENEFRLSYGENITEYVKHPVLHKHRELLRDFEHHRIFCVYHSESDGFYIEESCDYYYNHILTKEDCLKLSEMFKDIASYIE